MQNVEHNCITRVRTPLTLGLDGMGLACWEGPAAAVFWS